MKKLILTTGVSLAFNFLITEKVKAVDFIFNPTITFEVGDGFFTQPFDGQGDNDAIFPGNFDTVVKGTVAENSENAEFNISNFTLPPQQSITKAIFQAIGLPNLTDGSGSSRERPTSLAIRGYVGNGLADASDFQAGSILDIVSVSPNYVQEIYNFNVTTFIQSLVNNGGLFAGFGIRANSIGGLTLAGGNFFPQNRPKLIISTASITVPEPSTILGFLTFSALSLSSLLKRKDTFL